jgi:hypothetical protein
MGKFNSKTKGKLGKLFHVIKGKTINYIVFAVNILIRIFKSAFNGKSRRKSIF